MLGALFFLLQVPSLLNSLRAWVRAESSMKLAVSYSGADVHAGPAPHPGYRGAPSNPPASPELGRICISRAQTRTVRLGGWGGAWPVHVHVEVSSRAG